MNDYTDTGGSSGDWGSIIGGALNSWASVEREKEQTRQAEAYSAPWRYQDAQAKAQSYVQPVNGNSPMVWGLLAVGLLVGGVVLYKVVK